MSTTELNVDDILLNANSFDDSDNDSQPSTPLHSSQPSTPLHSSQNLLQKTHSIAHSTSLTSFAEKTQIALSPSAIFDTLQTLFSQESNNPSQFPLSTPKTPLLTTFLSFYQKHAKLFNLSTQPLQSPIEHRLQQYHAATSSKTTNAQTTTSTAPSPSTQITSALFSLTKLSNISQQLDEKKQFTGVPTAITTNHRFICIGTTLGFVWLFDQFQTRFGCLGTASEHRSDTFARGHVVSMDLTPDGDFLIVAHRNGVVVVWDILEKKIHKVVDDFMMPNSVPHAGITTNVLQVLALPKSKLDQKDFSSTQGQLGGAGPGDQSAAASKNAAAAAASKSAKDTRHLIPFLFANTNGGVAVVYLQRKFLVWTTDVKWVMNNPEKPILHVALLSQPPQSLLQSSTLTDFHQLHRTQSLLGQGVGLDANSSFLINKNAPTSNIGNTPYTPLVVEKFNLISVCFEERVMIVALDPAPKVLGVIPRDFTAPQSATNAGLKFHPIIRPFGPISSSWRSSRSINSGSSGAVNVEQIEDDANNDDEASKLDDLFKSTTMPSTASSTTSDSDFASSKNVKNSTSNAQIAGKDYTQVYNDGKVDVCKSYYTGTRSFQNYTNMPLLSLARGTLLQLFTAFDTQTFETAPPPSPPPSQPAQQDDKKDPKAPQSQPLPVAMEKVLIMVFSTEIITTNWLNETTLLIYTSKNPGIPHDLSPPNPMNELTVYSLDASSLKIFEHFTIPTSIPQSLQLYRSSEHQKSLSYDKHFHNCITATNGSNGFATILGQNCVVSTVKMLNFIDRITHIAENDWILALSVAYEAWIKMKQSGSSLRATRKNLSASSTVINNSSILGQPGFKNEYSQKSDEICIGIGSLNELRTMSTLGLNHSFSRGGSNLGSANSLFNSKSNLFKDGSSLMNANTGGMFSKTDASSSTSLLPSLSFAASQFPALTNPNNALFNQNVRLHPRDLLFFQTSPVFRHLLTGYTPPTFSPSHNLTQPSTTNTTKSDNNTYKTHSWHKNTNKVDISANDLVIFNHLSPSYSILDTNMYILVNSPIENSTNTPAVHSLCEKIIDLIVLQVDAQIRTYTNIMTTIPQKSQHPASKSRRESSIGNLDDFSDQSQSHSQHPSQPGEDEHSSNSQPQSQQSTDDQQQQRLAILRTFNESSISPTPSNNDSNNANSTTPLESPLNSDLQDEWHFAFALITVTIHTAIDICLKLSRSDVLLKLIFPRIVKVTNALLSQTANISPGLQNGRGFAAFGDDYTADLDITPSQNVPITPQLTQHNPPTQPHGQLISSPSVINQQMNLDQLSATSGIGGPSSSSDGPLSPHLFTLRDTPSAHPTTIFLHRLFTVILTGHRNDTALLDQRLKKHATSQGLFSPIPQSISLSELTPDQAHAQLSYQTVSPLVMNRLTLNQQRLAVVDDFFIESTASTLITETKFALWLLRDNAALQKSLQILHLPQPNVNLLPPITANSLFTFSLQVQRFLLQFKILLINIHPIYLSLLANNLNQYNEMERKKLLNSTIFPLINSPSITSLSNTSESPTTIATDTFTYPIYSFHTPILDHLYSPLNFASNLHILSTTTTPSDVQTSAQPVATPVASAVVSSSQPFSKQPQQQQQQQPTPVSPSQTLTIASILQLVGQHLQNGLDISYIATLVKNFALLDEFLHITQGLFSAPVISHHLLSHFGYLHNFSSDSAANSSNLSNSVSQSTPLLATPMLANNASMSSPLCQATFGKSYTTLHYLSWFLTYTSPHFSPYRPTLYDSASNIITNSLTSSQNLTISSLSQSSSFKSPTTQQPHSLLTTLFYYYTQLSQGRSFFENANIQFVLPRLTLSHIRAAQQKHPKLFTVFTASWEKQQSVLNSLHNSMYLTLNELNQHMFDQSSTTSSSLTPSPFDTNNSGRDGLGKSTTYYASDFFSPFDSISGTSPTPLRTAGAPFDFNNASGNKSDQFDKGELYSAHTGSGAASQLIVPGANSLTGRASFGPDSPSHANAYGASGSTSEGKLGKPVLSTSPSHHTASATRFPGQTTPGGQLNAAALQHAQMNPFSSQTPGSSSLLTPTAQPPHGGPLQLPSSLSSSLFDQMIQYAEVTTTSLYRAQIVSMLFSPTTLHASPLYTINPRYFSLLKSITGQRVSTIIDFVSKIRSILPHLKPRNSKDLLSEEEIDVSPFLVHNFPHLHLFLNEIDMLTTLPSNSTTSSSSASSFKKVDKKIVEKRITEKTKESGVISHKIDQNCPFSLFFALLCDLLAFPNWVVFSSTAALYPTVMYSNCGTTEELHENSTLIQQSTSIYAPYQQFNHLTQDGNQGIVFGFSTSGSSNQQSFSTPLPTSFGSSYQNKGTVGSYEYGGMLVGSNGSNQGSNLNGTGTDNNNPLAASIPKSFINSIVPSLTEANKPKLPHVQSIEEKKRAEEKKKLEEQKAGEKKKQDEGGLFGWFGKVSDFVSTATSGESAEKDKEKDTVKAESLGTTPQASSLTSQLATPSVGQKGQTDSNTPQMNKKAVYSAPTFTLSPQAEHYASIYSKLLPFPIPTFSTILFGLTHTIFSAPHLNANYNPYLLAFQHVLHTIPSLEQKSIKFKQPANFIAPNNQNDEMPHFSMFYPTLAQLKEPSHRNFFLKDNINNLNPLTNHVVLLLSLTYYGLMSNLITLSQLPPSLLLTFVSFACLAPTSHILAIYLINLSPQTINTAKHSTSTHPSNQQNSSSNTPQFTSSSQVFSETLPFFAITPPFPEITQDDLHLFHPRNITANANANATELSQLNKLRKNQVTQLLDTPRELLLLSLIPFVAGTSQFTTTKNLSQNRAINNNNSIANNDSNKNNQSHAVFGQFDATPERSGSDFASETDATTAIIQPVPVICDILDPAEIDQEATGCEAQKLKLLQRCSEIGYFKDHDVENTDKISTLLFLAESSSFSRALLSIYIQQRNFERVLTSFLAITQPLITCTQITTGAADEKCDKNDSSSEKNDKHGDKTDFSQLSVGSFEDGGLIDDGMNYDSSSDEEEEDDDSVTKLTATSPSSSSSSSVETVGKTATSLFSEGKRANPNKTLLRILSKQLFSYIASELYSSLSTAVQAVMNDNVVLFANETANGGKNSKDTVSTAASSSSSSSSSQQQNGMNKFVKKNGLNVVVNSSHFDEFFSKLHHVLSHADQLLQIYPLGIVTLYVLFSTAFAPLPELNFQSSFLATLTQNDQNAPTPTATTGAEKTNKTNTKTNPSSTKTSTNTKTSPNQQQTEDPISQDTSTLYLFLKHLLYCYDLHVAFNRGNNASIAQENQNSNPGQFQDDQFDSSLFSDPSSPSRRDQAQTNSPQNAFEKFTKQLQSTVSLLSTNSSFSSTISPTRVAELMTTHSFTTPTQANQRYLELLCKFEPKRVYHYLFTKQSYSIDHALELCRRYQIFDAMAYILERTGDLRGSLDLLLKVITREAEQIQPTIHHNITYFLPQTMQILATFYVPQISHYAQNPDNFAEFGETGPLSVQPALNPAPSMKKMNTAEYLALQRKHQDEKAFKMIDFGANNDVAHPSPHIRVSQYHDRIKHLLFYSPKVFSTLVAFFPTKLRRLVWYPVQIAMNLCQRASEQGSFGNSSIASNDLSSMYESTAMFNSTTGPAAGGKKESKAKTELINTQLNEWEALWMDLLLLLIRTERSIADTRLNQFNTTLLPKLGNLPTQTDIQTMLSFASNSSKSSQLTTQTSQSPGTNPALTKQTSLTQKGSATPAGTTNTPNVSTTTPASPLPLQPIDIVLLLLHASIVANIQRVLTVMLEYIPADKVLATSMKSYQSASFSSFQTFFNVLIESIIYELSLRDTTKRLLQIDHQNNTNHILKRLAQPLNYTSPLHRLVKITSNKICQSSNPTLYASLQQSKRKITQQQLQFNIAPITSNQFDKNLLLCLDNASLSCFFCTKPIDQTNGDQDSTSVVIFGCGHLFHDKCCGFDAQKPEHAALFDSPKLTTHTGTGAVPTNSPLQCPTCLQRGLTQQQSEPKKADKNAPITPVSSDDAKDVEKQQNMQATMVGVYDLASHELMNHSRFSLFSTLSRPVRQLDDDDVLAQDPQQINKLETAKRSRTAGKKPTSSNPFDDDLP